MPCSGLGRIRLSLPCYNRHSVPGDRFLRFHRTALMQEPVAVIVQSYSPMPQSVTVHKLESLAGFRYQVQ